MNLFLKIEEILLRCASHFGDGKSALLTLVVLGNFWKIGRRQIESIL